MSRPGACRDRLPWPDAAGRLGGVRRQGGRTHRPCANCGAAALARPLQMNRPKFQRSSGLTAACSVAHRKPCAGRRARSPFCRRRAESRTAMSRCLCRRPGEPPTIAARRKHAHARRGRQRGRCGRPGLISKARATSPSTSRRRLWVSPGNRARPRGPRASRPGCRSGFSSCRCRSRVRASTRPGRRAQYGCRRFRR